MPDQQHNPDDLIPVRRSDLEVLLEAHSAFSGGAIAAVFSPKPGTAAARRVRALLDFEPEAADERLAARSGDASTPEAGERDVLFGRADVVVVDGAVVKNRLGDRGPLYLRELDPRTLLERRSDEIDTISKELDHGRVDEARERIRLLSIIDEAIARGDR